MADTLLSLAQEVARARGPDLALDVRCWLLVGSFWADSDDEAWRRQLPMDPRAITNGRTMFEAVEQFPNDLRGIVRSWNVPQLTGSLDAAARVFPDGWFVQRSHQWVVDNFLWSIDFAKRDLSLEKPLCVEDCATEALARLAAALTALAYDCGETR